MPKCKNCGFEWESRPAKALRVTKDDFKAIGRMIKTRKIPKSKKACKTCEGLQLEIIELKQQISRLHGE
jgi:hypothetical protein